MRSTCGKWGGYRIRRDPSEVSLADVFVAVEGPVALNPCLEDDSPCSLRGECRVHDVWQELQDKMLEVLSKYTVEDVAPRHAPQD